MHGIDKLTIRLPVLDATTPIYRPNISSTSSLVIPPFPCFSSCSQQGLDGEAVSSGDENPQPACDQMPSQRELEAKIQCAITLLAWSTHRDNAHRLAKVRCAYRSLTATPPQCGEGILEYVWCLVLDSTIYLGK